MQNSPIYPHAAVAVTIARNPYAVAEAAWLDDLLIRKWLPIPLLTALGVAQLRSNHTRYTQLIQTAVYNTRK